MSWVQPAAMDAYIKHIENYSKKLFYSSVLGYLPVLLEWKNVFDGIYFIPEMYIPETITYSDISEKNVISDDEYLEKKRKITEVEAELLQMFPPNWTNTGMTKRQRYFMMGNALVTGVISKLEDKLKKIISDEDGI